MKVSRQDGTFVAVAFVKFHASQVEGEVGVGAVGIPRAKVAAASANQLDTSRLNLIASQDFEVSDQECHKVSGLKFEVAEN